MKIIYQLTCLPVAIVALIFSSCKKDEASSDTETTTASAHHLGQSHFDALFKEVDNASRGAMLQKKASDATVTFDTIAPTRTMTVDYGNIDKTCSDGAVRRGKLLASWTGSYGAAGTVIEVIPENFFQDNYRLNGTTTIQLMGRDSMNRCYWTVGVASGRVTRAQNDTVQWSSTRTITWASGEDATDPQNHNWLNDRYLITGTSSGATASGTGFAARITKPVSLKMECIYRLVSGLIELTPNGKAMRVMDYGSGSCESTMSVVIGSKVHIVSKN